MKESENTNQKRGQVIYEQAPWNRDHIEALYPILEKDIIEDGQWHEFPTVSDTSGRYRVVDFRYFQAVFGLPGTALFDEFSTLAPIQTADDAEWLVTEIDDYYEVTSVFAVTPALSDYDQVYDWLYRHALVLKPHPRGVQGTAYFTDIEADCLLDAVRRLTWLENVILSLNRRLVNESNIFWSNIKQSSDAVLSSLDNSRDWSGEIVPLPSEHRATGFKHREPV